MWAWQGPSLQAVGGTFFMVAGAASGFLAGVGMTGLDRCAGCVPVCWWVDPVLMLHMPPPAPVDCLVEFDCQCVRLSC